MSEVSPNQTRRSPTVESPTITIKRDLENTVLVEGTQNFTLAHPRIQADFADGQIKCYRGREIRVGLSPAFPDKRNMLIPFGLVFEHIAKSFHRNDVTIDLTGLRVPAFRVPNMLSDLSLPARSIEFLRNTKMALVEVSTNANLIDFAWRLANSSHNILIMLAAAKSRVEELERTLGSINTTQVPVFNTARMLAEADVKAFHENLRRRIPVIILGTPQSILATNLDWQENDVNVVVADERLLMSKATDFFWAIDDPRSAKRLLLCLPPGVTTDPKWETRLFEFGGPWRFAHKAKGHLVRPPVYQTIKINWSASGNHKLQTEVDVVDIVDTYNRRLRAIASLFTDSKHREPIPNSGTVLVFPMRKSVEQFVSLVKGFSRPEEQIFGRMPTSCVVCTLQELEDGKFWWVNTIVWAGARSVAYDFNRMLLNKRQSVEPLTVIDLEDFAQSNAKRSDAVRFLRNTLRNWVRSRKSQFRKLGYADTPDEETQTERLIRRIAGQTYLPLNTQLNSQLTGVNRAN